MQAQAPEFLHCIKALSSAFALSKQAIQIEIAVAFVVFHQFGSTDLEAKKALRNVYASAGRADCLTPDSPSYQTVTRRINRCAAFCDAVGVKKVRRILKDVGDDDAIEAVKKFIEPYGIETMDDVAARAGKPVIRTKPEDTEPEQDDTPHARRATDAPGVIHVKTKHIDLPIPPDAPATELVTLANKLLALAKKREA